MPGLRKNLRKLRERHTERKKLNLRHFSALADRLKHPFTEGVEKGEGSIGIRWVFAQPLSTLFNIILGLFVFLNVSLSCVLWLLATWAKTGHDTMCLGGESDEEEGFFSFMDIGKLGRDW